MYKLITDLPPGEYTLEKYETISWDQKKYPYNVKYVTAKHYKDNIASHKAFLKAGYEEWKFDKITRSDGSYFYRKEIDDDTFDWKIKEIE